MKKSKLTLRLLSEAEANREKRLGEYRIRTDYGTYSIKEKNFGWGLIIGQSHDLANMAYNIHGKKPIKIKFCVNTRKIQ